MLSKGLKDLIFLINNEVMLPYELGILMQPTSMHFVIYLQYTLYQHVVLFKKLHMNIENKVLFSIFIMQFFYLIYFLIQTVLYT